MTYEYPAEVALGWRERSEKHMSEQVAEALHQQAHALDAGADNGWDRPLTQKGLAAALHELADRILGRDPATVNAEAQAQADQAAGATGLSVQLVEAVPQAPAQHDPMSPGVP